MHSFLYHGIAAFKGAISMKTHKDYQRLFLMPYAIRPYEQSARKATESEFDWQQHLPMHKLAQISPKRAQSQANHCPMRKNFMNPKSKNWIGGSINTGPQ